MKRLLLLVVVAMQVAVGQVRTGADLLVAERLDLVRGKRVGLVTNHTGRVSSGGYLVDTLRARGVDVTVLFGPEHGIRGAAAAGEKIRDAVDPGTGIPVYSLYGETRKPTQAMLRTVDVLLYDIQDVGARFYTYISTMGLCMEAAAEAGIPFIVLDRPNPLGGMLVDGPVLEDSLRSFVGMYPVPVVYGLTAGELALMINGEGWLAGGRKAALTVVPMEGWHRAMLWPETGLPWVAPSPNIPTPEAARIYPATCLIEATNVSEGRGTDRPFEQIGAPFIDTTALTAALRACAVPGVSWSGARFIPRASKFKGVECSGIRLAVGANGGYRPLLTGVRLLRTLQQLCGSAFTIRTGTLARLAGTHMVERAVRGEVDMEALTASWTPAVEKFVRRSEPFRLYH